MRPRLHCSVMWRVTDACLHSLRFRDGRSICVLDRGWSDRRPIPLRALSILSPQRPSSTFFP